MSYQDFLDRLDGKVKDPTLTVEEFLKLNHCTVDRVELAELNKVAYTVRMGDKFYTFEISYHDFLASKDFDGIFIAYIQHAVNVLHRMNNEKEKENTMSDILKDLPQYHFDRDEFCKVFHEIFTSDQIYDIEAECQGCQDHFGDFSLFYDDDEFYILHRPSGIMINWYKHLGRTNTCNRPDFTLDDLRVFLETLKEEL